MERHELFDTLDAVNPRWQKEHPTVGTAARAHGLESLYADFLRTPEGQRYVDRMSGVTDWSAISERNRRQREAELRMAGSTPVWFVDHDQPGWDE